MTEYERLHDVPMHELEDWTYRVITAPELAELYWEKLKAIDLRYCALAILANPEFGESVRENLLRGAQLYHDPECWRILFWATVLDGDHATVKLIVHQEVQEAYDREAQEDEQGNE